MAKSKKQNKELPIEAGETSVTPKTCFVIMPISDQDGYEKGHFTEVYNSIIKPACENLEIEVHRADETKRTNLIHIEILQQLLEADIAICDLSSRNPNVMFELGIRQAFDKPVVLIKDEKTPYIFDINILRHIEYDSRLKFLDAKTTQNELKKFLLDTYKEKDSSLNSIVRLMSLPPAEKKEGEIGQSELFEMMMNQFARLDRKIDSIEKGVPSIRRGKSTPPVRDPSFSTRHERHRLLCSQINELCALNKAFEVDEKVRELEMLWEGGGFKPAGLDAILSQYKLWLDKNLTF